MDEVEMGSQRLTRRIWGCLMVLGPRGLPWVVGRKKKRRGEYAKSSGEGTRFFCHAPAIGLLHLGNHFTPTLPHTHPLSGLRSHQRKLVLPGARHHDDFRYSSFVRIVPMLFLVFVFFVGRAPFA